MATQNKFRLYRVYEGKDTQPFISTDKYIPNPHLQSTRFARVDDFDSIEELKEAIK
ncbi:MAG: hypothetical protein ACPGXZ_10660 [Saprospiraceae bacterium]